MFQQWYWFVYIIECNDGTYYTGCTRHLSLRYEQHLSGRGSVYTAKHGVKTLAYSEAFESLETARIRERQIQRWSQAKKRNLSRESGDRSGNPFILRPNDVELVETECVEKHPIPMVLHCADAPVEQ